MHYNVFTITLVLSLNLTHGQDTIHWFGIDFLGNRQGAVCLSSISNAAISIHKNVLNMPLGFGIYFIQLEFKLSAYKKY